MRVSGWLQPRKLSPRLEEFDQNQSLTEREMQRLQDAAIDIHTEEMQMETELEACIQRSDELRSLIAESKRVRAVLNASRNHLAKTSQVIEGGPTSSSLVGLTVEELQDMTEESRRS